MPDRLHCDYNDPFIPTDDDLKAIVQDLRVTASAQVEREDEEIKGRTKVKWENVKGALRNVTSSIDKFEERPQQVKYANFCTVALNEPGTYVVEAGTGTGKTLAYLVSACEYARLNPSHIVVIATSTKNLMRQILEKDWRAIRDMPQSLYRDLRVTELKGKNNYLCISGLRELYLNTADTGSEYERGNASTRLAWLYLYLLATRSNGICEDIPPDFMERFSGLAAFVADINAQEVCHTRVCTFRTTLRISECGRACKAIEHCTDKPSQNGVA